MEHAIGVSWTHDLEKRRFDVVDVINVGLFYGRCCKRAVHFSHTIANRLDKKTLLHQLLCSGGRHETARLKVLEITQLLMTKRVHSDNKVPKQRG